MSNETVWFRDFDVGEDEAKQVWDKTGNGATGTFTGGAGFNLLPGFGRVLRFPEGAHGARVEWFNTAAISTMQVTLSIGISFTKFSNKACIVVDKDQAFRFWFEGSDNVPTFSVFVEGQWHALKADRPLELEKEYWVTCNYNNGTIQIMANAVLVANAAITTGGANPSESRMTLGDYHSGGWQFEGEVTELLFRNIVTTPEQHRLDLLRSKEPSVRSVIELLEIDLPTGTLRFTTNPTPLTLTVRP